MIKVNCITCSKEIKSGQKPYIIDQQIYCNPCGKKKEKEEEKLDRKVFLKMRVYSTIETLNDLIERAENVEAVPKNFDKEYIIMEEDMEKLFARYHVYQKGGDLIIEKNQSFYKIQPEHKLILRAQLNQAIELDRKTLKKRWWYQSEKSNYL